MSDRLTPVLAYRALVHGDERTAPSFLLESVEQEGHVGRTSLLGVHPLVEVSARGNLVTVRDHRSGASTTTEEADPLSIPRGITDANVLGTPKDQLPDCFTGGWVGYVGYDSVRWLEPGKLPFSSAPEDDRNLPDMCLGLYQELVAFDHVRKTVDVLVMVDCRNHDGLDQAWDNGRQRLDALVERLSSLPITLAPGFVDLELGEHSQASIESNFPDSSAFEQAVERTRDYIRAGDAFQVVLSQRFRRVTTADPFDIYRALRVVNPSPYQIYMQTEGCILVASSPEILCRVRDGVVTNRPLAGTRRRGANPEEDQALEDDLMSDEKERAEHVMLVDLGRNDLGRVCDAGTISIDSCMEVERYSHVMHISSTLTGRLRGDLDQWDALRATLPVGTVSGAPKVRAMQIIDELEPTRRGPYAGGIGVVGLGGGMDIALALRTMVIPIPEPGEPWTVDIQAGAGVVLDSVPKKEFEETVNKAAALGRAIDLAERAFGGDSSA
ncbi:MAG: anthranilate synthase component I [Phycisphaerales bacterium]|nr:anthranilate synthase component I [Phycisphaerales bacterium]